MRKLISMIMMLIIACAAGQAEPATAPSQEGLDAAGAVVAMHAAVMEGVIGSDYRFSELAGGDSIYVLYTDPEMRNYLMISLDEESHTRADMAVIQCYSLKEFDTNGLDSLAALATPFIGSESWEAFEGWLLSTAADIRDAALSGGDVELTYYTGTYIACAMSLYHTDDGPMFTLIASWNTPLSAEDVSALMTEEE